MKESKEMLKREIQTYLAIDACPIDLLACLIMALRQVCTVNCAQWTLAALAQQMADQIELPAWLNGQPLVDAIVNSFPIIMAKGTRADSAKVAVEVADKGYCSSKNLWYHGIKLHKIGISVPGSIPLPQCIGLSAASENDNIVFKEQMAPYFSHLRLYAQHEDYN